MKLVEKALLYKPRTAATPVTWASYVTALAPLAWWRMRDTSGVTVVNSGSLGSAVDLTATAWTMAQAGQLGAGEAGLADGANTLLQCANNATLGGFTDWERFFLMKPTSAGENSAGILVTDTNSDVAVYYQNISGDVLWAQVTNTGLQHFVTKTTNALTLGAWGMLFVAYANSGDKKIHLFKGAAGTVTELFYSAQPALTGTYRTVSGAHQYLNSLSLNNTYAGLMDEMGVIGGRTLTPAERLQMTILAGV